MVILGRDQPSGLGKAIADHILISGKDMTDNIIAHSIAGLTVGQRHKDGYVNATALTAAHKAKSGQRKDVANWLRLKRTIETLEHLASVTGIPVTELYQVIQGGIAENQGTWIYPKLATRFAIWLSDEFGYAVECWVEEWMTTAISPAPMSVMDMIIASAEAHKLLVQRQDAAEQLLREAIAQKDEEIRLLKASVQTVEATIEVVDMESQANSAELERFRNGHGYYFSIAGWCRKQGWNLSLPEMNNLGRKASAMCKTVGIQPVPVNDPRWGEVNTYPDSILMELV